MDRPLGWWKTAVESSTQAACDDRTDSDPGSIVVLANALSFAAEPLYQAQLLLPKVSPRENSALLNSYLYVGTVLLRSVLDGIASAVQQNWPLPDVKGPVSFESYTFVCSHVVWIQPIQTRLTQLQHAGKTFFECADVWVGRVSANPTTDVKDVHDAAHRGYVYDVLVPVYRDAKAMVCRLAELIGEPLPTLYIL